jgi:N-acetylmuramoyl-L-alanine amidase
VLKILDHRLVNDENAPLRFQPSPCIGKGQLDPKYLIIHYTEGQTLAGAVITLTTKENKVSSHVVIGRDGTVVQLVPFDKIAWHASVSSWNGLQDMNQYSIGIELDNAGMLQKSPQGWRASFGRIYPDKEVLEAVHKFGTKKVGWHTYPTEQLKACQDVAVALVKQYGLEDILGHDDIAPKRKWDPGPAFPMEDFRKEVMRLAKLPVPGPGIPVPAEEPQVKETFPPVVESPQEAPPEEPPVKETPPPVAENPKETPPEVPAETVLAKKIPVIEYHDTEYTQGPTVVIHTEWFLAQLQWLSDNGYKTLTGEELVRFVQGEYRPPQKSFALRFDLGAPIYRNFKDVIIPALKEFSFRAFFFMLTSMTKEENREGCVSWANLIEWEKAGYIEVASHGTYHPDYKKITPAQRLWDARESKRFIEEKVGHPILFFGFPMDSSPEHPEAFLRAAGYSLGFVGPRMERSVLFKDPDPFALPCYYPYSDPRYYPAINGMKGLDFGGMIEKATECKWSSKRVVI